jgi:hypothetical protein
MGWLPSLHFVNTYGRGGRRPSRPGWSVDAVTNPAGWYRVASISDTETACYVRPEGRLFMVGSALEPGSHSAFDPPSDPREGSRISVRLDSRDDGSWSGVAAGVVASSPGDLGRSSQLCPTLSSVSLSAGSTIVGRGSCPGSGSWGVPHAVARLAKAKMTRKSLTVPAVVSLTVRVSIVARLPSITLGELGQRPSGRRRVHGRRYSAG